MIKSIYLCLIKKIYIFSKVIIILEVRFFTLKDKICAWEFYDTQTSKFSSGGARPFKRLSSLDSVLPSDYYNLPYTKKQLKSFDYIALKKEEFEKAFLLADEIQPYEKYDSVIRQTFGINSNIYKLYAKKALPPKHIANNAQLYIDFEAINMRICGWYAILVDGEEKIVYDGISKPYTDDKYISRLWKNVYSGMLPYDIEQIKRARHIRAYKNYFIDMFRRAKHIYTYGDTDALFIKTSFGEDLYNFFKVKNIDVAMRMGSRTISLDKACGLFNINTEGDEHDPKNDVEKMMKYMEAGKQL